MVTGLLISRATRCCKEAQTETKGEAMSHPVEKLAVHTITAPNSKKIFDNHIKEARFGWRNREITWENFGEGEPKGEYEVVLLHFGYRVTTKNALAEIRRRGFEPGSVGQLIVRYNIIKTRGQQIAALGSTLAKDGIVLSPWIHRLGGRGDAFDLRDLADVWGESVHFLAYRKKEVETEKTSEEKSAPFRIHDDEFELTFPGYVSPSEIVLVGLTQPISGKELLERMRETGLQLVTASQLLAWEKENHERSKGMIELHEDEVVVREVDKKDSLS